MVEPNIRCTSFVVYVVFLPRLFVALTMHAGAHVAADMYSSIPHFSLNLHFTTLQICLNIFKHYIYWDKYISAYMFIYI